jgi:hypothetical protein
MKYRYKMVRIWVRLHRKLICAEIAAKLIRLAFKISPDFEREYANTILRHAWEEGRIE